MFQSKKADGPKGNFFFGSTKDFAADTLGFVLNCRKQFGDIAHAKIAFKNFYFLFRPEYFSYILQENYRNYSKSFAYKGFKTILGNGLLTSEGDFWLKQRRLAQPAFHKEKLESIVQGMNDSLNLSDPFEVDKELNFTACMRQLTQEIVTRSLFGTSLKISAAQLGWILEKFRNYANDKLKNPFMLPLFIPTSYNQNFLRSLKELDHLVYSLVKSRKENTSDFEDLLSLLMNAKDEVTGEGMNELQLRDEIATIYVAGQETTANAMCFIFYLLSINDEENEKVKNEIRSLGKVSDFTLEDLSKLNYTKLVIQEALRLYPPAWAVSREALEDDHIGNYFIPKGSTIFLPIYALHRDESIWEDANSFKPSRFEPGNFNKEHKKAYIPFGTGARVCIGNNFALLEMQLITAYILSKYDLIIQKGFNPSVKTPVTLSFKNDLKVFLKRIK